MPASDWTRLGGRGGATRTSTISSVSVEKNVFFASVNYARVQYYALPFTSTNRNQNVPFWKSFGVYLGESLINFLYLIYLIHYFNVLLLLKVQPYPSIIVGRKILMSHFTAHVTCCPPPKNRLLLNIFQNISHFPEDFFGRIFWKRKLGRLKDFREAARLNWVFCWKYHKLCVQLGGKIHRVNLENMIN